MRALYVMYATAQSLLRAASLTTGSHTGVTTLLSSNFVKPGHLEKQHVASYTQTLRNRLDADYYGYQFTAAEAEKRLDQARQFMEVAERILAGS